MFTAYIISAIFGAVAAFMIVGRTMTNIYEPSDRVKLLIGIMIVDILAVFLTSLYLPAVTYILFIFTFTKFALWSIMNHKNVVHLKFQRNEIE